MLGRMEHSCMRYTIPTCRRDSEDFHDAQDVSVHSTCRRTFASWEVSTSRISTVNHFFPRASLHTFHSRQHAHCYILMKPPSPQTHFWDHSERRDNNGVQRLHARISRLGGHANGASHLHSSLVTFPCPLLLL
ncbi:hypothetical protein FIBSPDRAFT_501889 [Athelia psychrophila]|uniref:Uncharacterized protein n=1 Tax=Athelia psychrophila TaxID=1759441 RepID=A0A167TQD3_9AGAM|nr:hypothetical protein FIBSPDRAFT_501889 [Fibularhizoctonia sp. CBS 109695]